MRDINGRFVAGEPADNKVSVGTVRIRTRHKRRCEQRAFIKIEEPNKWVLLAQFNWEKEHGPIPLGFGVHHKDRNKLNDDPSNLELESKASHLAEHRPEFQDKCVAALLRARQHKKWSTRSTEKRTGRHPKNCACTLHAKAS